MEFVFLALLFIGVMSWVGYTVLGGVVFSQQAISLNWPERMTYNAFVRRVNLHLKHSGWTVQMSSSPEYTMGIRRDSKRFYIVCVPTDHALTPKSVSDYCQILKKSSWAQALFCITADRMDAATANSALGYKVFVIHYRDIDAIEHIYSSYVQSTALKPS